MHCGRPFHVLQVQVFSMVQGQDVGLMCFGELERTGKLEPG